jgi:hypothetical protein
MATAQPRVYDALPESNAPIPAFKVVEVPGPLKRTIVNFDEKTKQITRQEVVADKGYLVCFPRGHSIMKFSLEELDAAGFGEVVPLIQSNLNSEAEINEQRNQTTRREIIRGENK